jgi:hypothetical protein
LVSKDAPLFLSTTRNVAKNLAEQAGTGIAVGQESLTYEKSSLSRRVSGRCFL